MELCCNVLVRGGQCWSGWSGVVRGGVGGGGSVKGVGVGGGRSVKGVGVWVGTGGEGLGVTLKCLGP